MLLLDTNVIREYLKRVPNAGVVELIEGDGDMALSVITLEEMAFGLAWRPLARLQSAFDTLVRTWPNVYPITKEIAHRAGALRGQFQQRGETRTAADMLIAATAQEHRATLCTRNTRDFEGCGIALLDPFRAR